MSRKKLDKAIDLLLEKGFTVSEKDITQTELNAVCAAVKSLGAPIFRGDHAFVFHVKEQQS